MVYRFDSFGKYRSRQQNTDKTEEYIDGVLNHEIVVFNAAGEPIYSDAASAMHAGVNSYVLYTDNNGKDYILKWKDDLWMGTLYIGYEIFSFDGGGNKIIFDKDELYHDFPTDQYEWANQIYPTDEINDFAAKINGYLKNGFVLMSTRGLELKYSTPGNLLTEEYIILEI
jgi:hypothetical protein